MADMKHKTRDCVRCPVVKRQGKGGSIKVHEWECPECGLRGPVIGLGITCDGKLHRGMNHRTLIAARIKAHGEQG